MDLKRNRGELHLHTEHSLDSGLKAKAVVKKAKELGFEALAITNHGNMYGIDNFMAQKGKDDTINLIPGCEIYYGKERFHMILLAKNYEGYLDICNIVTESNAPDKIVTTKAGNDYPITTEDILRKNSHGNIIATSACVGGILSGILLHDKRLEEKNKKLKISDLEELNKTSEKKSAEIKALKKEISELKKKEADNTLIEDKQAFLKISEDSYKKVQKEISIALEQEEKKKFNISQMHGEEKLYAEARAEAIRMLQIFGKNNFFIEIQNHGMEDEAYVMPILYKIACETGIPMVATNDVHVLNNNEDDFLARNVLQYNSYKISADITDEDRELYLKTNEELHSIITKILPEEAVNSAIENITYVQSQCNVIFPKGYHYPVFGVENADAELRKAAYAGVPSRYGYLSQDKLKEIYEKIDYELSVISKMGFSDYLLIESDFLNVGKKVGHMPYDKIAELTANMAKMDLVEMLAFIDANQTEPGEMIGPGRGSAAGSIVCYTTGITNIDPIKFGLIFERFLNPDRVSMPDIDSDFSLEVRDICVEYCRKKYGREAVCGINTVGTAAAKGSIRLVARAMAAREMKDIKVPDRDASFIMTKSKEENDKDAIKQSYLRLADQITKVIPNEPGITLAKVEEELNKNFSENEIAMKIINTAKLIEGSIIQTGTHAAGVIIADRPVSDYISLMYDTVNQVYKVQCNMVEAEGIHGLLKFDFLGLRTLSIITMAVRLIKENKGVIIDLDNLPEEREVIKEIYAKGNTNGVFQFESPFMKKTLKEINPETLEDLILINAVGRPGPMDDIPAIAASKKGLEVPKYVVEEMREILEPTYGYPVYQEQIMSLMQLAGMTPGEADNVRRHMSKKHVEEFMAYQPQFIDGIKKLGGKESEIIEFWDGLVKFAKYAFNKSHAAAYTVVSYQTAWLKYHYPAEFMTAAMEFNEVQNKLPGLINDAKKLGVQVLPPDINKSQASFTVVGNDILFGLCSIKSCGDALRKEIIDLRQDGASMTLADFILKKRFKIISTNSMIKSGAFDNVTDENGKRYNRASMLAACELYYAKLDEIKKFEKAISDAEKKLELFKLYPELETMENWAEIFESAGIKATTKKCPKQANIEKTIQTKKLALNECLKEFYGITIPEIQENKKERLNVEKEYLGLYISEHPLSLYEIPENITNIENLEPVFGRDNTVTSMCGIITNLKITARKSDNEKLAFFTLEDQTGDVKVNCWTKSYKEYEHLVKEGNAILLDGVVREESKTDDNEEITLSVSVNKIEALKEKTSTETDIVLYFDSTNEANCFFLNYVKLYENENGYPLILVVNGNGKENQVKALKTKVTNAIKLEYENFKKLQNIH